MIALFCNCMSCEVNRENRDQNIPIINCVELRRSECYRNCVDSLGFQFHTIGMQPRARLFNKNHE